MCIISLWQRMVASVPYVKATEPHLLETYTPEVTQAYITSRLESVAVVMRDGLEDPLDDNGMVTQQLDQLSVIGRCEYGKTCQLLVQVKINRRIFLRSIANSISLACTLEMHTTIFIACSCLTKPLKHIKK